MRWVTCDEWHEIETWWRVTWWWRNDETWDEWHKMSDMWWVTSWLTDCWPYTFCEFPFLNPLVNPLLNPFLIPWGQAEWRNDETWDEWWWDWDWHEWETSWIHIHMILGRQDAEGLGKSYWGGGGQRSPVILCGDEWAECHGQKLNVAIWQYIGSNLVS